MIQARDISFNIEYGRFIKPIEDKLHDKVQFGKGTNNEIANKIYRLSKRFKYYTECDHTTFDAHVTPEMLRLTHTYYQSCYYHNARLRQLSRKTINNNCRTRDGIKYRVKGTRMSGDVDTSLGNSLINYAILKEAVTKIAGACEILVNGDDSIIFTKKNVDEKKLVAELRKYNMESKVQKSVTNIHKVEFCRQKLIINSAGEPALMIDPKRLVDIYGMTYKQQRDYVEYLRQVCICNIAINISNPLAQYWSTIYKIAFDNNINLMEIFLFKYVELRTKQTAIKELAHANKVFDSGEYNQTVYAAWGNLDYLDVSLKKITKKIKKIKTLMGGKKINTEMLKYLPVVKTIYVNHNTQVLRKDF